MNAVVAVEPRTDLVNTYLPRIVAPTLFIAPEKNTQTLTLYRTAIAAIATDTNLDIVIQARKRGLANTLEIISGVQIIFLKSGYPQICYTYTHHVLSLFFLCFLEYVPCPSLLPIPNLSMKL